MQAVVERATGPRFSPDKLFTITAQIIPQVKPLKRPAYVVGFLGAVVATSAKVGKLMVRKEISPERTDVMLCLDTDANSYSTTSAFANTKEEFDFELFQGVGNIPCLAMRFNCRRFSSISRIATNFCQLRQLFTNGLRPAFDG